MAHPLSLDHWAHKNPAAIDTEKRKNQLHHQEEAMRYAILAAYAKHNTSFGEAVALEKLAEKHRLLALS